MHTIVDTVNPPGLSSVLELAAEFAWTTTIHPATPGRTRVELDHGPHTILTWWLDNGSLWAASHHMDGYHGEFNQVASTTLRSALVAWVTVHGTKAHKAALHLGIGGLS